MSFQFISQNDARVMIVEAFKNAWNDAVDKYTADASERTKLKARYLLDNVKVTPAFTKSCEPYAKVKITQQHSRFRGLVGGMKRYEGNLEIRVCTPAGRGMEIVDRTAAPFIERFGKANIGGVRFRELNPIDAGVSGQYFDKVIDVPFHYYSCEQR